MIKRTTFISLVIGASILPFAVSAEYIYQLPVKGVTKYDRNGFDFNGIHKDTGTAYDSEGFDVNNFDEDGYDREGLDSEGNRKTECAPFNGLYYTGTNTSNHGGPDFYGMKTIDYQQWQTNFSTRIIWNGVLVGTGSGYSKKYGDYAQISAPTSFEKEDYRYYFETENQSWYYSVEYRTYTVCREKIR